MSVWMYVAGIGALLVAMGLLGVAKTWLGYACGIVAGIAACGLFILAAEEADRETSDRCQSMGALWHPVDGGGVCVTSDGRVLFSD